MNAWSVGKGVLALLTLSLVERGLLDLDEPVRARWPDFAAEGKHDVTLRTLMSHRAGLPSVRRRLWSGCAARDRCPSDGGSDRAIAIAPRRSREAGAVRAGSSGIS